VQASLPLSVGQTLSANSKMKIKGFSISSPFERACYLKQALQMWNLKYENLFLRIGPALLPLLRADHKRHS